MDNVITILGRRVAEPEPLPPEPEEGGPGDGAGIGSREGPPDDPPMLVAI